MLPAGVQAKQELEKGWGEIEGLSSALERKTEWARDRNNAGDSHSQKVTHTARARARQKRARAWEQERLDCARACAREREQARQKDLGVSSEGSLVKRGIAGTASSGLEAGTGV